MIREAILLMKKKQRLHNDLIIMIDPLFQATPENAFNKMTVDENISSKFQSAIAAWFPRDTEQAEE